MRIGCLQFSPQVANVDGNLNAADAILNEADPVDLDLLVLPELAFTGYNFKTLAHIAPFLEDSNSGISSLWARNTALKHDCTVVVGYPEKVDPTLNWPTDPEYYNSAIVVNGEGETVANYRKTHLYYTDETWALEGSHGFFAGRIPGIGRTAIGICMDLNPYKFEAPWDRFEFAQHALNTGARLVIVSMAWLTHDDPRAFNSIPQEPDTDTLLYWVSRLEPIIQIGSNEEVIVVFANRCGAEDEVTYVGTSAVIGIQSGEIKVYGILGRGERDLLVVDTEDEPYAKLVYHRAKQDVRHEDVGSSDIEDDVRGQHHPAGSNEHRGQSEKSRLPNPSAPSPQNINEHSSPNAHQATRRNYREEQDNYLSETNDGQRTDQADRSHTRTPKAQSPSLGTPSLRLEIPSEQYMLQRYLASESPVSRSAILRNTPLPASMESLTLSELSATSKVSMHSIDASKGYWSSPTQLTTAPTETFGGIENHRNEHDFFAGDKHHSWRSDISVWNNQPGRVRDIAVPLTAPPEMSHRGALELDSHNLGHFDSINQGREGLDIWIRKQQHPVGFHSRQTSTFENPILGQTSQSQLRKNSNGQADELARSYSSSAVLPEDLMRLQTTPKSSAEHIDRGRRRSSQRQQRERRHRSHSNQLAHDEHIDLSQFALIEEYPSLHCPVHGSRPSSGTRHRHHSGVRSRVRNNRSQLSQEANEPGRPSNGRSRSRNESQQAREGSSAVVTSRSSKDISQSYSTYPREHNASTKDTEKRASTAKPGPEPKTPTAMLLVRNENLSGDGVEKTISPLKCMESSNQPAVRRRVSSVW